LTKRDEPDELAVPFFDDGKNVFFIDLAHGDRYYKSHSAWKHQQNEITSQHPAAVVSLFFLATSYCRARNKTNRKEFSILRHALTYGDKKGKRQQQQRHHKSKVALCMCAIAVIHYIYYCYHNIDLFNAICYAGRAYIFLFLLYKIYNIIMVD
jgi:hypothetical protein